MTLKTLCSINTTMNYKKSQDFVFESEILDISFLKPFYCLDIKVVEAILEHQKLLITSKNGVIGLLKNLEHFKKKQDLIKNKEILTVGSKTFDLLIQNGFLKVKEASLNIEALKQKHKLEGVLYVSGFHTAFHDYSSYGIIRKVVYKTIQIPLSKQIIALIEGQKISNVLLYSKRNAEAFLENFSADYDFKNIRFICISQNVARVMECKTKNVVFPLIPNKEEMLKLVVREQK